MNKREIFSGWRGSLILMAGYLFAEIASVTVGGNFGAFAYVTFHFIIMPMLGMMVGTLTIIRICRIEILKEQLLLIGSLIVPALIILIAATGDTTLPRMLGVAFSRLAGS